MAERRSVQSSVRARTVRDYRERVRQLTDAFNLPDDVQEWVTVRHDPDNEDETLRRQVVLHARAGQTVASVEVNAEAGVYQSLTALLNEHRGDLHAQLKSDLAVNLMAGITEGPPRERE